MSFKTTSEIKEYLSNELYDILAEIKKENDNIRCTNIIDSLFKTLLTDSTTLEDIVDEYFEEGEAWKPEIIK